MHWIDWAVVAAVIFAIMIIVFKTRKYAKTTADFLAANRCARRYLLAVAEGIAGIGAITIVGSWQMIYKIGFSSNWWSNLSAPLGVILFISGWVIYRYREARVLTLAQLFESRYSRRFRILAGFICFISGLLNFGLFPAIGANFFIYYCGLPLTYSIAGLEVSTHITLVILLTGFALTIALSSGQIAILVTDFFQSMFVTIILSFILIVLLTKYSLVDIFDSLLIAEPGKSMVNPFDAGKSDFNPLYFFIGMGASVLSRLSWQGSQGYNCSAISPHEAKMAGVIGGLKGWSFWTSLILIPLIAYMIMHHPNYADQANQVTQTLSTIENDEVRDQMIVPVTMLLYMPIGLIGAFASIMFIAFVSTNDTYMHSWATIFVQDVVMPLRKKPLANKQHLLLLRLSLVGVALFAIIFSSLFRQTTHILYFFAITGALWLGGCGTVIVGGLYTQWGTTKGAYAALISGTLIASTGFVFEQVWKSLYNSSFFLTGQEIYGVAMAVSVVLYVGFSLLGKRQVFDLDKLFHRGKYVIKSDHTKAEAEAATAKFRLKKLFGFTKEFTIGDKIIYGVAIGKSFVLLLIFLVVTVFAFLYNLTDKGWCTYHFYYFFVTIIASFIIAIWIIIGGFRDLFFFIRDLKVMKKNTADDGHVADNDNCT